MRKVERSLIRRLCDTLLKKTNDEGYLTFANGTAHALFKSFYLICLINPFQPLLLLILMMGLANFQIHLLRYQTLLDE